MDPITRQLLQQLMQMFATKDDGTMNPNGAQDVQQMLADPMQAALMGNGGLDPQAFLPDVEWEDLDVPLAPSRPRLLDTYAAGGDETPEGYIASSIADGVLPEAAIRSAQEAFGDELDDDALKSLKSLGGQLLTERTKFEADQEEYDQKVAQLPKDENGQPMSRRKIIKDSKLTEQFREAGLPLPTDQFDASYFTDTVTPELNREKARAGLAESEESGDISDLKGQLDQLRAKARGGGEGGNSTSFGSEPAGNPWSGDEVLRRAMEKARGGNRDPGMTQQDPIEVLNQMHASDQRSDLGSSSAGRHASRVSGRVQNNYDDQITGVAQQLRGARDKEYKKVTDTYKGTAEARGRAHGLRMAGETPLKRALIARLVGLQGG